MNVDELKRELLLRVPTANYVKIERHLRGETIVAAACCSGPALEHFWVGAAIPMNPTSHQFEQAACLMRTQVDRYFNAAQAMKAQRQSAKRRLHLSVVPA
jgi:hypothetical protein